MAETAAHGEVPTFKLVLVGDGGTGKVSSLEGLPALLSCDWPQPNEQHMHTSQTKNTH
jgi:hypothetical protein